MASNNAFRNSLSVDVDYDGQLQIKCHPMFAKELEKIVRDIASMARKIVRKEHHRTGNLERSIQPYAGRSARGHVRRVGPHTLIGTVTAGSSRAKYARHVHEGTRPHIIRARQGGVLAFTMDKRYGRSHFIRSRRVLMSEADLDDLERSGTGNEYYYAVKRRERRQRDWAAGRDSFMRPTDFDTKMITERVKYKDHSVVVDEVHHPGYQGHRFLNQAAAIVVGRRVGGTVNLGSGRFGRNNATWQRW